MKNLFLALTLFISLASLTYAQIGDVDTGDELASPDCLDLKNNLRYRATDVQAGGEVSDLQDFLQSKGFLGAAPSGYFGRMTLSAVRSLQASYGIIASGYVGPVTRAKIKNETCSGSANGQTDPSSIFAPPQNTTPYSTDTPTGFDPVILSTSVTQAMSGTSLTLYGRGFGSSPYVFWNGVQSVTPTAYSSTHVTFVIPAASPGVYTVQVSEKASPLVVSVANTAYITVVAPPAPDPVITSASHTRAYPGTLVTLFGRNFTPGSYVSWDDNRSILPAFHTLTEISFTIPPDAALGSHTVRVGQKGNPVSTAVANTLQIGVIARPDPVITSISETRAAAGDPITLFGYNFDAGSYVLWDGAQSITPRSYASNQLTFVVPQGAAPGTHTVQVGQKASPFVGSVANTVNIEVVLLFY